MNMGVRYFATKHRYEAQGPFNRMGQKSKYGIYRKSTDNGDKRVQLRYPQSNGSVFFHRNIISVI